MNLTALWRQHYQQSPDLLATLPEVGAVVSAFNVNVDAICRVTPERLAKWIGDFDPVQLLAKGPSEIREPSDVMRGLIACLRQGIAAEWIVTDPAADRWMRETLGHDRLQMGGQAGIIGNTLALAGLPVLVHAASLPTDQASLFFDLPNLLTTGADGQLAPVRQAARMGEAAMVHLILEFAKGEAFQVGGERFVCPRSNRFIATYDPLNCGLAISAPFSAAVESYAQPLAAVVLSGYQMLSESLADGGSGLAKIDASRAVLERWRERHPPTLIHLEVASTQDLAVRQAMVERIVPLCDSLGCNEQELAQILEVLGEEAHADKVRADLHGATLTEALIAVFQKLGVERIQLHYFGMYLTIQRPDARLSPEANRRGMALGATLAATKAGTGALDNPQTLLWAHGRDVSALPLEELGMIARYLSDLTGKPNQLVETGIYEGADYHLIAVPTILIEKPVSLVGMGDTISALSLVGTLAAAQKG